MSGGTYDGSRARDDRKSVESSLTGRSVLANGTFRHSVTTATSAITLPAGVYKMYLASADPSVTVYLASASSGATVAEPGLDAAANHTQCFRGDEIERLTVLSDEPSVAFILSSGATSSVVVLSQLFETP